MNFIKELENKLQQAEKTHQNLELREQAWKNPDCQKLYRKIVEYAGGFKVVRPGMRGQAKQMAITCFIKNREPNFDEFRARVEKANMISSKWRRENK